MVRSSKGIVAAVVAVFLGILGTAGTAGAVDAPKWVAALFVEAQKMVGLRWTPVPGATAYKVLRSTTAGADYKEITSSPAPQYFDKEFEPGTTYYYVLQAVAGAEVSPNSAEKSVVIPGEKKKDVVAPPKWTNATVQQTTEFGKTNFKVGLFWEKSKSPDIVAYNVYRSEVAGKDYQMVGSTQEGQLVDAAVVADKTYYYVLTATDSAFQETPYSEERKVELKAAAAAAGGEAGGAKKEKEAKYDVVVKKTKFVLEVPLPEAPQFQSVADFVYHPGEDQIYVVDNVAAQVAIISMTGERVKEFGVKGYMDGNFSMPVGICLDNDDNVVVTDIGRRAVITFKPNGNFVREFKTDKKFKPEDKGEPVPVSCAVNKDGDIWVTDNTNSHLLKYSPKGELLEGFGEAATKGKASMGYMSAAGGLDIDTDGRLLLQDYGSTRIQVFDGEGKGLFTIGENVKGLVGAFVKVGKPYADTKRKVIWGLDNAMGNIQAFDWNDGKYLYTLTNDKGALKFNERADWNLTSTRGIAADNQGRLWVMQGLDKKFGVIQPLD